MAVVPRTARTRFSFVQLTPPFRWEHQVQQSFFISLDTDQILKETSGIEKIFEREICPVHDCPFI